jgi:hypothetical protein
MRFTGAEGAPQQNVIVTSAKGLWGKARDVLNPTGAETGPEAMGLADHPTPEETQ